MELMKSFACKIIDENEKKLKELGAKVWTYAEPGGMEIKTSAAIRKFLKDKEFTVTKHAAMKTGFRAEFGIGEFGGAKRPNVCFLCRYDASYGRGHVYGHNLVVEATIGAAIGLQEAIRSSSTKIGKVTVIGCPNSVKNWLVYLLNWKSFKDIDVVLTAIPGPQTCWYPTYLGSKTFRAIYKSTYKKSDNRVSIPTPEALSAAVFAINNMLSVQEHFAPGWKAEGIISDGGKMAKEVPSQCEAIVKLIGPSNIDLALLEKRVVPCLEAAATSTRCQLELDLASKTIYSVISNTLLGYCLQLNAYHCGLLSTPLKKCNMILDPVDFGNLSHKVPAIRPMFYVNTDEKVGTLAFRDVCINEKAHRCAVSMAKALAMTAIDVLINPETLGSIKEEHCEILRKEKEVRFEPFGVSKPPDISLVPLPVPPDTNTGWSRLW